MGEKVRRIWLLVAVGAAALLAFAAAWPSAGTAAEPAPRYLVRDVGAGGRDPQAHTFVTVADQARLVAHLAADRENSADLEIVDETGRVVVLRPDGQLAPTGEVLDPEGVKQWLRDGFRVRRQRADGQVRGDLGTKTCQLARQTALSRLTLPTQRDNRELTLAETLVEADRRIAAMHQPVNRIPVNCLIAGEDHRAGYLHNLWHRISGS